MLKWFFVKLIKKKNWKYISPFPTTLCTAIQHSFYTVEKNLLPFLTKHKIMACIACYCQSFRKRRSHIHLVVSPRHRTKSYRSIIYSSQFNKIKCNIASQKPRQLYTSTNLFEYLPEFKIIYIIFLFETLYIYLHIRVNRIL